MEDIEEINSSTVIIGVFNTPLSTIDRSSKKFNKDIVSLNDTLDEMDVTDRAFHPKEKIYIYTLFKYTWVSFKDRAHGRTQTKSLQIQEN